MLYLSIFSLLLLATTTLYVLVKYSKKHFKIFILIPLLISSSLLSYIAFKSLEGAPIKGYPPGDIAVLASVTMKPDILIVVRHKEGDLKSYLIPFDSQNAGTMNREKQLTEKGVARSGRFEKNKFGDIRYVVDLGKNPPPPPKAK